MDDSTPDFEADTMRTRNGIEARYGETDAERVLVFEYRGVGTMPDEDGDMATGGDMDAGNNMEADGDMDAGNNMEADGDMNASRMAVIAQNRAGYGMLKVRRSVEGDELERYYGFDMALDHAAELLGVAVNALPVPKKAADMGM